MSEVTLRYYGDNSDREEHQRTIDLLKEINRKHEVDVEVERVSPAHGSISDFPGEVRQSDVEEVYSRDFERNRDLSTNVGQPPSDAFKTNSGYIVISGTVGVIDGGLRWAAQFRGYKDDTNNDPNRWAVNFLQNVAEQGTGVIEDQYGENVGESERAVVNRFIESDFVNGKTTRSANVGTSLFDLDGMNYKSRNMVESSITREIDIVVEEEDLTWIIEAKKEYSAGKFDTALGQALVSARLYQKENDLEEKKVQPAVLLGSGPELGLFNQDLLFPFLTSLADDLGVKVIIPSENDREFEIAND